MGLKETIFSRQFDYPPDLLPEEVADKKGSVRLIFTLTEESNGYAIWKQVLTWPWAHAEDCDEVLTLVSFEQSNKYSTTKYDAICKTLILFNIAVEAIK